MNLNDFLQNKKRTYKTVPSEKLKKTAKLVASGKPVSTAMREAGFSKATAKNPQVLTSTANWKRILEKELSDDLLAEVHVGLMSSQTLGHMVFPLGPKGKDDNDLSGANPDNNTTPEEDKNLKAERTTLTDKEIKEMLAEVNCKVKRIVHGENARHVYFWSPDNNARRSALDLAYKLKGKYAPEKHLVVTADVDEATRSKIRRVLGIPENQ